MQLLETIVIASANTDPHARVVKRALEANNVNVLLYDTESPNFGRRGFQFEMTLGGARVRLDNQRANVRTLWNRRLLPKKIDPSIHDDSKSFVAGESRTYDDWLLEYIDRDMSLLNVNPIAALKRSENKFVQLNTAKRSGLNLPDTLITRDADAIRRFAKAHQRVVLKPMRGYTWGDAHAPKYEATTTIIDDKDLDFKPALAACPAIYQEFIPKCADIRAVVIGRNIISTRYVQTEVWKNEIDIRIAWRDKKRFRASKIELNNSLRDSILKMTTDLNLNFASIDLVESDDDRIYFLDLNPGGQFLFNELAVPDNLILKCFCEHLVSSFSADVNIDEKKCRLANFVDELT